MLAEAMLQIYAHGLHGYVGASARVAPLREYSHPLSGTFSVVQPVRLHQHTRAARAHKSANMVSAEMVSILPRTLGQAAATRRRNRSQLPL